MFQGIYFHLVKKNKDWKHNLNFTLFYFMENKLYLIIIMAIDCSQDHLGQVKHQFEYYQPILKFNYQIQSCFLLHYLLNYQLLLVLLYFLLEIDLKDFQVKIT